MKDNKNKTIIFDTQISHDSHIDDKQVSPWVKQNNKRVSLLKVPKKLAHQQYLTSFISQQKSPLKLPEQYLKRRRIQKNTIEQDFRARAEQKFKQLIKKTLAEKRSLQLKSRLNHTNLVKINLEYNEEQNFKVKPLLRSLDAKQAKSPKLPTRQKFYIRKPRNASSLSHSKLTISPQSRRYDGFETQQKLYKTLELNLPGPIKNIRRIAQISTSMSSRSSPSNSPSLSRPKLRVKKRQRQQKEIDYNIMVEGINLKQKRRQSSTRREKIRKHNEKDLKNEIQKVFLT